MNVYLERAGSQGRGETVTSNGVTYICIHRGELFAMNRTQIRLKAQLASWTN
jgi:hypothetical protein